MNLNDEAREIATKVQIASRALAKLTTLQKKEILSEMATALGEERDHILSANKKDLEVGKENGLSPALLDRLTLNDDRIRSMIKGLRAVAELEDPVGKIIESTFRPNGILINKIRVPIGVIAIIYEARPNVTVDAAALCFYSSNAVILRGGKESLHTNTALAEILCNLGIRKGLPQDAIYFVTSTDRDLVAALSQQEGLIDLIIPRGGEALVRAVIEAARVPVIKHYKGVCHAFIDDSADFEMACSIVENAKCQRPGVCNALETLLIHQSIAEQFLPLIAERLRQKDVELRGDRLSTLIAPSIGNATDEDWYAEYLSLILSIKVVPSLDDAISHINFYGSHHSDVIVTNNSENGDRFCAEVDSAAVYVNVSTRFTDGQEFGMGAEIGISTDKLHARGPMGLEELTSYKYIVKGQGQIRA